VNVFKRSYADKSDKTKQLVVSHWYKRKFGINFRKLNLISLHQRKPDPWQIGNTGTVEKTMGHSKGKTLSVTALLWPHFSLNNCFIVWRHRRMGNWDEKFFFVNRERET